MANVKISQLTAASSASGTQEYEVNESGTSKKVTGSQLLTYIEGEISSSPTLTGQVSFDDGTNSLPSITNTGDTNTGIYFPGADQVGIATGGTLRVTVDSSGNVVTTGNIELGNASDTTVARASAGRISVEGATVAHQSDFIGQQTIWVPASAMTARTTNGAASGSVETTTNKVMLTTLDFDTTTQEFAQFAIQMPKGWDEGTLIAQFIWSHAATTTNFGVVWQLAAVAFADDDAADTAFGTAQTATDTGGTTNDIYISPETSAITVAGSPAAEEYVVFQVARVPANASDTMAIDARLHGVKVHYTIDAGKDD